MRIMKMIDDDILSKLEKLSYIKIDPNNKENIKHQINEILNFVENLNQLNIKDDINTNLNVLKLRDDTVINSNVGKQILESAPNTEDNFFIVPKIIE